MCDNRRMNAEVMNILRQMNNDFYQGQHESFSVSRSHAWPGWDRLLGFVPRSLSLDVLDVACGNLRFERYLASGLPHVGMTFTCLDNCEPLVADGAGPSCAFVNVDVIDCLARGLDGADALALSGQPAFDLAVSFGFMHHIPGSDLRLRFLDSLLRVVAPGGIVALSFWRFASDEKLMGRANRTTAQALETLAKRYTAINWEDALEPGDYIIGWNNQPGALRYCHSFDDAELDRLVRHVKNRATVIDRYRADGRTGALNDYLVLHKGA